MECKRERVRYFVVDYAKSVVNKLWERKMACKSSLFVFHTHTVTYYIASAKLSNYTWQKQCVKKQSSTCRNKLVNQRNTIIIVCAPVQTRMNEDVVIIVQCTIYSWASQQITHIKLKIFPWLLQFNHIYFTLSKTD